jgi:hypothetical protein
LRESAEIKRRRGNSQPDNQQPERESKEELLNTSLENKRYIAELSVSLNV